MIAAVLLAVLGGCVAPETDKPDTAETGTPAVDDLTVTGLTVEATRIETVLRVTWETATPMRSDVTATFGDDVLVVAETEATTTHDVVLIGIPAQTEVAVRVTADGTTGAAEATATTGALPAWVPDLTYAADVPEAAQAGLTFAPVILSSGGGILGIDGKGRVVWTWPPDDQGLSAPPWRAVLSLDGQAVLFNSPAFSAEQRGPIFRVPLDGGEVLDKQILGAHTDFVEYTPGGYLALGWDIRESDGRRVLGDTIRELAPDGTERLIWTVWDHFSPDPDREYDSFYPADPTVQDWSHINGISYDAENDDVLVSATFNNSVIRVDRSTGEQVWWLADAEGDFSNPSGMPRVQLPHSAHAVDGGVLVFSRGNFGDPESCSSAVEIALDETTMESSVAWSYESPDCLLVTYLGSAERLSAGNTLVTWTTGGRLDEVTRDGELAWQVSTSIGAAFGFSTRAGELRP